MHRCIGAVLLACVSGCAEPRPLLPAEPAEIARLQAIEDARDPAVPDLADLASSPQPDVRARAALAMGRMTKEPLLGKLLALAADQNAVVRRTAVQGLGQYGFARPPSPQEKAIIERVRSLIADPEESVRAAVADALGKLGGREAPALVRPLFADLSPLVRGEAALACLRWRRVLRMRDVKGDLGGLPAETLEGLFALAGDRDAEVRWRAAYVLIYPEAAVVLRKMLADENMWARTFAVRNLKTALLEQLKRHKLELAVSMEGLPQHTVRMFEEQLAATFRLTVAEDAEAIAERQSDLMYFVRVEAVNALAELDRKELIRLDPRNEPSFHVRVALASAGCSLDGLAKDKSPSVRAAVLRSCVRAAPAAQRKDLLLKGIASDEWIVREAALEEAAALKGDALELLKRGIKDAQELVVAAAIGAAGQIEGAEAFQIVKDALANPKLTLRGTAVDALGSRAEPEVTALAMKAFDSCEGEDWVEVRESIIDVVAKKEGDETTAWLKRVLAGDPSAAIQRKAAGVLIKRKVEGIVEPPLRLTHSPHAALRFERNPVVVLYTSRGRMALECLAREAPVHVANFVGHVKKGFYDGLTWHRVVPNFVIQGGDPLGTGWGNAGYTIRAEINDARYVRGAMGMPRTADFDTGGCQLFISHIPTPHLDGLYTVFARVIEGFDVIDQIERGDRIDRAFVR